MCLLATSVFYNSRSKYLSSRDCFVSIQLYLCWPFFHLDWSIHLVVNSYLEVMKISPFLPYILTNLLCDSAFAVYILMIDGHGHTYDTCFYCTNASWYVCLLFSKKFSKCACFQYKVLLFFVYPGFGLDYGCTGQ